MPSSKAACRTLFIAIMAAGACGCSNRPAKPALMADNAKSELTVYRLRTLDYELAAQFSQLVASCARRIIETSPDPDIRSNAYEWRLWASPQARAAAFDQDPLAGLLDLWVLAAQQSAFFIEGRGRDWFGDEPGCAGDTVRHLEREAEQIAAEVLPEARFETISRKVRTWAAEHPIEGQLFVRPTVRADLASFFEAGQGGLKAVGSIEETLRDINDRLTILTVQMPIEARWHAELLVSALFEDQVRDRADSIVGAMDEMSMFLDDFERTLSDQTTALLDGFEAQRLAVFEAVEEEREMILGSVQHGGVSIMDELEEKLASTTAELDAVGRGLIDHFFKRLIEIMLASGAFVLLVVLLVLFVMQRRTNGND